MRFSRWRLMCWGFEAVDQPQSSKKAAPAIAVDHLKCGYARDVVLNDVSFTVAPGEIFFIIGGSGCGKSTLLRNLVGLNQPLAGAVKFFGESFTDADTRRRRELLK